MNKLAIYDWVKLGLSISIAIILLVFRYSMIMNNIASSVLLSILIFDIVKYNKINNPVSVLIHYFTWILIISCVIYIRRVGLNFWSPLVLIFFIKPISLIFTIFKFKKLYVTKSILGNLWLISMALYLLELILNSTHGLASYALKLAIISTIETTLIIIISNKLLIYEPSIVSMGWKKIKHNIYQ